MTSQDRFTIFTKVYAANADRVIPGSAVRQ